MNGTNLSGNPGVVHSMRIPPLPLWLKGRPIPVLTQWIARTLRTHGLRRRGRRSLLSPVQPYRREPYHHRDEDAYLHFIAIAGNSFSLFVVKRQRFLANDLATCLRRLSNRAPMEQGGQANVCNLHLAQQGVDRFVDRTAKDADPKSL
jgi:hypothetical protein